MKITKSQLESIIREELETVKEGRFGGPVIDVEKGQTVVHTRDPDKWGRGQVLDVNERDPTIRVETVTVRWENGKTLRHHPSLVEPAEQPMHENYQEYRKEYEALKPHVVEALGYSGSHYVALALEALMHDVKDDVLKGKDWNKDR